MKKLLSVVLCLVMIMSVLSLMPITSSAKDADLAIVGEDDYPYSGHAMDGSYDPWKFCYRNCTSFVAWRLNSRNGVDFNDWYGGVDWGWAGNWGYAAQSIGITVDNTPAVGAVAWQSSGHVAWVSEVYDDSSIYIEEYNWDGDGKYHSRPRNAWDYTGFIHIKDINPIPVNAWLNIDKSEIFTGDSITFTFGAEYANGHYAIGIEKGNERIWTEDIWTNSYTFTFNSPGEYSAYVTCYGDGGYAETNMVYFKVFEKIPVANAWITIDSDTVEQGVPVTFTYGADHSTGHYSIGIDKGNERILTKDISTTSFTYTFDQLGEYSAYVTCYGYGGYVDSEPISFTVIEPQPASNAWINADKEIIEKGQAVTFTYGADHSNGYYAIGIDKGETRIITDNVQTASYICTFTESGVYSVYVTCYGNDGGYEDTEHVIIQVYDKIPALNAWIRADKTAVKKGQAVTFTYGADYSNGYYAIGIDKGETRILTETIQTTSYAYTFSEPGVYSAYVTCFGEGGYADTEKVYITVYEEILGDANGDGNVDTVDATLVQRYATGMKVPYDEALLMCADVDGDGSLTVVDATFIQRYATHIKIPYPIGEEIV